MEKYIYRPVRFYLITFACTWFWWLFAILLNEGTGLYLGMFLGLVSPAVVAVVTVFTSKNKALINDFKKKLIGFYRIKPKYILIAVLIFAVIVTASIGTSVLFGGSINQFSFTEDFSFSIGGTSAFLTILLASCIEELGWRGYGEDAMVHTTAGLRSLSSLDVSGLCGMCHYSGYLERTSMDLKRWESCM